MNIKKLPSQQLLKEHFDYVDGQLVWKKTYSKAKSGKPIGWVEKNGYVCANLNGTRYRVHRLVFMYFNGFCPDFIDHIDGNKQNNSIENLRQANTHENACNRSPNKNNKLQIKGVCFDQNKFKANIKKFGKSYHLGYFQTKEEAAKAYVEAAQNFHGEFAWKNLIKNN